MCKTDMVQGLSFPAALRSAIITHGLIYDHFIYVNTAGITKKCKCHTTKCGIIRIFSGDWNTIAKDDDIKVSDLLMFNIKLSPHRHSILNFKVYRPKEGELDLVV